MKAAIPPDGDVHTPYGATEALPVASISASEVLAETAAKSPAGGAAPASAATFPASNGKSFASPTSRSRPSTDAEELPPGEIGELIVRGPVVTTEYVTRTEANALHKIRDGETFWHRMGDVGYLEVVGTLRRRDRCDDGTRSVPTTDSRFWFCGRKSHRVITRAARSSPFPAKPSSISIPGFIARPLSASAHAASNARRLRRSLARALARSAKNDWLATDRNCEQLGPSASAYREIDDFLLIGALPVDIRHNAKIFREKLAVHRRQKRVGRSATCLTLPPLVVAGR